MRAAAFQTLSPGRLFLPTEARPAIFAPPNADCDAAPTSKAA